MGFLIEFNFLGKVEQTLNKPKLKNCHQEMLLSIVITIKLRIIKFSVKTLEA